MPHQAPDPVSSPLTPCIASILTPCAIPSCAMLCHAVPCCAMLCHAVLRCATLCHAVPCRVHCTPAASCPARHPQGGSLPGTSPPPAAGQGLRLQHPNGVVCTSQVPDSRQTVWPRGHAQLLSLRAADGKPRWDSSGVIHGCGRYVKPITITVHKAYVTVLYINLTPSLMPHTHTHTADNCMCVCVVCKLTVLPPFAKPS